MIFGRFGSSWKVFLGSWGVLEGNLGDHGGVFGVWGASWAILGRHGSIFLDLSGGGGSGGGILGSLGGLLEHLGGLLGPR